MFSKDPQKDAAVLKAWQDVKPADADKTIAWLKSEPIGNKIVNGFFPLDYADDAKKIDAENYANRTSGAVVTGRQNIADRTEELTGTRPYAQLEMYQKKYQELGRDGYQKWLANRAVDEGAYTATNISGEGKILNPDDAGSALEAEFVKDKNYKNGIGVAQNATENNFAAEAKDVSAVPPGGPETLEQARTAMSQGLSNIASARGKVGVGWYDDMAKQFSNFKVRDIEVGKKIADSYDMVFKGLFKLGKIGGNLPGAAIRALVGNHTMALMAGLDAWRPEYNAETIKAFRMLNGWYSVEQSSKFIDESFFQNPKWIKYLDERPGSFEATLGVHPAFFNQTPTESAREVFKTAKDNGVALKGVAMKDISKTIDSITGELKGLEESGINLQVVKKRFGATAPKGAMETAMRDVAKVAAPGAESAVQSTMFPQELSGGAFQRFIKSVETKLTDNPDNKPLQLLNWYLKRPMNIFCSTDGAYKMGYAKVMTNIGISEKEVTMLSKFYPLIGKGIEYDQASKLYKIDPEQAIGAVNEIFMNYSTMPSAVKVMRSLPFMGAPFGSFMYGMGVKTGKAVAYNPAIFNKINFFLKEFQGDKTPLERQQLAGPYYSWYNRDGMIKLPFFQQNPVYMNIASMIPYYTMNMLQPSERVDSTEGVLPSTVKSVFDKLPFFQQPEGRVLMDYFVLPTILRESNPQGQFGQPLWKTDSTNLEKFGYAMRDIAETPLPTMAGLTGLVGGVAAPGITEDVPSFRYRQLANAVQGKTSLGVSTKDDPIAKAFQVLSGIFGLPWYKMNLSDTLPTTSSNNQ